jgi:hypothetical protein
MPNGVHVMACLNGMTSSEKKSRHTHVTSARGTEDWSLLTSEAKDADNHALQLKLTRRRRQLRKP